MTRIDRLLLIVVAVMLVATISLAALRPIDRDVLPVRETNYKVDLNSADAAELSLLPGIGPTLAQRIVEGRAQRGRYVTADQLANVKGIGVRTLEKVRPYVTTGVDSKESTPADVR